MSAQQGLNLLVFRPGRRRARGLDLKRTLLQALEPLDDGFSSDAVMAALLRAGELECSVADSDGFDVLPFAELTECLSEALLHHHIPLNFPKFKDAVLRASVPEQAELSVPEGFAHYALHPLGYADVLEKLQPLPSHVVVIGIRSIGTTLSAMTAAAARQRGLTVSRMTVRPGGHPYDRKAELSSAEKAFIQDASGSGAKFLIVDEGPGLSGSTFLSVAEALEAAGVPAAQIILLCGHEPDLNGLCAANAAERWKRFRSVAVTAEPRRPAEAETFIGAGEWRRILSQDECKWPESWTSMERLKYLSTREPRRLFKFAGLGHYGDQVFEHEQAVAAAGFGPEPQRESGGFVSYPWLEARPMTAQDISRDLLTRLAEYCAFRAEAFPTEVGDAAVLQEMAEHNLQQFNINLPVALKLERPVIADGRMQPHEWLLTETGEMLKTDSGSHGDDHFFPGPTDIAWDLVGAIVEWRMDSEQASYFLERYTSLTGDKASRRVADFIHAYSVFRCAYCKMAANAMRGTPEQSRLEQAAASYAGKLPVLRAASGV